MSAEQKEAIRKQLQSFLEFANTSESKLLALVSEAKLDTNSLIPSDEDEYCVCPFDSSHRVCKRFYSEHMWHVHHYDTKFDVEEDISFFYETAPHLRKIQVDPLQPHISPSKEEEKHEVDIDSLPIINQMDGSSLELFARMDPSEMEKKINGLVQLPLSFLQIEFPKLSIPRLDAQISTLFGKLGVLQDQDLINIVIAMLLNAHTSHPDVMCMELQMFLGSQSRMFVLQLYKYLARTVIRRVRDNLIAKNDPNVQYRQPSPSGESKPRTIILPWTADESELISNPNKQTSSPPLQDYKRRRQSYRAKMTHLTKRTVIQEHRDMINLKMSLLAEREGYHLLGPIDRITTKTTPQEIEKELRQKRITPKEFQFQNPLEARNSLRKK